MGNQGENLFRSLKRKVLWTIFGPVLENGCKRKHKNSEIYKLYDEHDDVKFTKLGRHIWAGHVMRMEESEPAKNGFLYQTRRKWRQKERQTKVEVVR
jgi:hypothetical protein